MDSILYPGLYHEGAVSEDLSQISYLPRRDVGLGNQIRHPQMSQNTIIDSIGLDLSRGNRLRLKEYFLPMSIPMTVLALIGTIACSSFLVLKTILYLFEERRFHDIRVP
jgi:hypothetical protein